MCADNVISNHKSQIKEGMRMIDTMRLISRSAVAVLFLVTQTNLCQLSSYSRNDPYPMYTALDPHTFLYTRTKMDMKGEDPIYEKPECIGIHISPFAQFASCAKTPNKCLIGLGDIDGRWNLIGTLFGKFPQGITTYPGTVLTVAQQHLYPNLIPGAIDEPRDIQEPCGACSIGKEDLTTPAWICGDEDKTGLGFLHFPLTYRKAGLRAEFDFQITQGFGVEIQAGVADICQTGTSFQCKTPENCCSEAPVDPTNVEKYLVCQYKKLAEELCLDLSRFHETALEDLRIIGYWRRAYPVNKGRDDWSEFLAIPFVTFGGVLASGKEKCPNRVFGVPFGSNGHSAVGASAGIDLDFVQTIEIGGEVGFTHFFSRDYCKMPIPNSPWQSGIYPFKTDVTICPGMNWHFGLKLQAFRFIDKLSVYFEYLIVQHRGDHIKLKKPDSAFLPQVLERRSCWQSQMGNIGFWYDVSPAISLGFLWQAPFVQKGVYKSTTVMFTFAAFF